MSSSPRGSMLFHVVAVFALALLPPSTGVVVFNVGLPRTGTTSFHFAAAMLNLTSQHVAFNRTRYDMEGDNTGVPAIEEFRQFGTGRFKELFDSIDAFSDTPIYGLIPAIKKWYPHVAIAATHRRRDSWLASVERNPSTMSAFLVGAANLLDPPMRVQECSYMRSSRAAKEFKWAGRLSCSSGESRSDLEMAAEIYDTHQALLDKYSIPLIDIDDPSDAKWNTLLGLLPKHKIFLAAETCLRMSKLRWPEVNAGSILANNENRVNPRIDTAMLVKWMSTCDSVLALDNAKFEYPIMQPGEGWSAGAFRKEVTSVTAESLAACPEECVIRIVKRRIMMCQLFMSDLAKCGSSARHKKGINCTTCPATSLMLSPTSPFY